MLALKVKTWLTFNCINCFILRFISCWLLLTSSLCCGCFISKAKCTKHLVRPVSTVCCKYFVIIFIFIISIIILFYLTKWKELDIFPNSNIFSINEEVDGIELSCQLSCSFKKQKLLFTYCNQKVPYNSSPWFYINKSKYSCFLGIGNPLWITPCTVIALGISCLPVSVVLRVT